MLCRRCREICASVLGLKFESWKCIHGWNSTGVPSIYWLLQKRPHYSHLQISAQSIRVVLVADFRTPLENLSQSTSFIENSSRVDEVGQNTGYHSMGHVTRNGTCFRALCVLFSFGFTLLCTSRHIFTLSVVAFRITMVRYQKNCLRQHHMIHSALLSAWRT